MRDWCWHDHGQRERRDDNETRGLVCESQHCEPWGTLPFWREKMITEDAIRQNVYQHILKATNRRLEQAIPGSSEGAFARLSLAAVLNLLFLIRGEWGSIFGDFVTTQRALRA